MLRKFFSFLHDAKGRDVRVLFALAALLAFWPASELGVSPGCGCFAFGRLASKDGADVNFVTTMRAFHVPKQ